ncbi:MAG: ISAs1 family transposase [Acidobacteria bacterium Pan2503]|uniref:ISAs1 family transposase n=1 Tax=Candidatus Acidiferrum panamense TaxID=2741543 RepID=A0A7V8T128_9BACT|nr:ISAs1 family transposase [Candidatus Acidoferrum panamensis]
MEGFKHCFEGLEDPRTGNAGRHDLLEMLMIALCTVVSGGEDCTDMAEFARTKLEFLRGFLKLEYGAPSHDTFSRLFRMLDPEQFGNCFQRFMTRFAEACQGVVAIDGKVLRRSFDKASGKSALHMVSAWGCEQRLVLGQIATDAKSNEITAVPKLLKMLSLEGCVVTVDALNCQREIARQVVDQKADYVLALKGNQGTLHEDVKLLVDEQKARDFKDTTVSFHSTVDGDHGRIETRKYTAIHDVSWLQERHDWPGLTGVLIVESTRELANKTEQETRYYITSLSLPAERVGPMIRDHWAVENSLHWVMDMVFRDDECRVRTDNAPKNFVTLKHMANNLIRRAKGKDSQRLKRMTAAWDDDYLASLVAA